MFEHYEEAKTRKAPKWVYPLFMACTGLVATFLIAGWVYSMWEVAKLEVPKNSVDLAAAPPPPPPPPPPPGGKKPTSTKIEPKKIKVKDLVQPVKIEKKDTQVAQDTGSGDPDGVEGGVEGGVAGGVVGGEIGGVIGAPPPPPPPPPPPVAEKIVPPNVLNGSRKTGDTQILPTDKTAMEIERSGKTRLNGVFKICLTSTGAVKSVTKIKSTGFPDYDSKIIRDIQTQWKYNPVIVGGTPIPACAPITFNYSI